MAWFWAFVENMHRKLDKRMDGPGGHFTIQSRRIYFSVHSFASQRRGMGRVGSLIGRYLEC